MIMGDADDSYDFLEVAQVRGESPSKGSELSPGLPPSRRRREYRTWRNALVFTLMVGNPLFSLLVRTCFTCSDPRRLLRMRGFTKALYERLDLRCTGMEFATGNDHQGYSVWRQGCPRYQLPCILMDVRLMART